MQRRHQSTGESTPGLAVVVGVASAVAAFILPMLVTVSSEVFHLSAASAGRVMAAEMLGFACGSVAITFLLSRATISRLMVGALLIAIASDLLTIALGSSILLPLRLAAGLGEGGAIAAMTAVLAGSSAPERYYAFYLCSSFIAATIMFRAERAIIHVAGPHAVYWILATVNLVALPAGVHARKSATPTQSGFVPVRRQRRRTILIVVALGSTIAYLAAWTTTWTYAVNLCRWSGLPLQACDGVLSYAMLAGLAGAALAAVVGSRLGSFIPILCAGTTMTVSAILIALKLTPATYPVAILLWMGGMQLALPHLIAVTSAADTDGAAASISFAAQMIGISIGPVLGALVVNSSNASALAGLSLALLLPSVIAILAVVKLLGLQTSHEQANTAIL